MCVRVTRTKTYIDQLLLLALLRQSPPGQLIMQLGDFQIRYSFHVCVSRVFGLVAGCRRLLCLTGPCKNKKRLETLKREFCFFFSFHSVAYYIQREERCERKERACGGDEMERKGERESERDSVGGQMTFFLLFFISIFLAFSQLSLSVSPYPPLLVFL